MGMDGFLFLTSLGLHPRLTIVFLLRKNTHSQAQVGFPFRPAIHIAGLRLFLGGASGLESPQPPRFFQYLKPETLTTLLAPAKLENSLYFPGRKRRKEPPIPGGFFFLLRHF